MRMKRPTRVVRSSLLVAQRATPSFSASVRMLRNFARLKVRPPSPTRVCRYSTGEPDSSQMQAATASIAGQASSSRQSAAAMSKARLLSRRAKEWSKPPEYASEDGSATSSLISPASRSKNIARSTTEMPFCAQPRICSIGRLPRRSSGATTTSSACRRRASSGSGSSDLSSRWAATTSGCPGSGMKPMMVKALRSLSRRRRTLMRLALLPAPRIRIRRLNAWIPNSRYTISRRAQMATKPSPRAMASTPRPI